MRYGTTQTRFAVSCFAVITCVAFGLGMDAAHADFSNARLDKVIQLRGRSDDQVPVVSAVSIHPNGHLLATAGDDHIVRLWDADTGRLLKELRGHRDWVTAVAFCGDGDELITGCRDNQVLVWDVASGRLKGNLGTHNNPITSIVVSKTADKVAIAGFRAPLKIYDLASGKLQSTLDCPCNDIRAVAFSSDLRYLAAGGRQGDLRLWDLKSGNMQDLQVHDRRIRSLVFTADGRRLISAGEDQTVCISQTADGALFRRIELRAGKVLSMAMLDAEHFAVASADNLIRICRMNSGHPIATLHGHTGSIAALASQADTLISGSFDTTVRIWSFTIGDQTASDATLDLRRSSMRGSRPATVK